MSRPLQALARVAAWSTLVALVALVVAWLLDITGRGVGPTFGRALLALAALSALVWLVAVVARQVVDCRNDRAWLLLPLLVLLSFAAHWIGAEHEVDGYYYADEGMYAHHVEQINGGALFPRAFVYPHLLFYVESFANWLVRLAPAGYSWVAAHVWGVDDWTVSIRLLYRLIVATFGALTVIPVYRAASLVSDRRSGVLAGLAMIFSPVYLAGAKLNTCDVPSAFFAGLCLYFVARLTVAEEGRTYVLAGVASGLAAGSKYPAGLVAAAIVVVWSYWRVRTRRWSWTLVGAGLASFAAFLATTPGLVVDLDFALNDKHGIMEGFTVYSHGKWVGVVADSNLGYYLGLIVRNFGLPLLVIGGLGLVLVPRATRVRVLLLSPFSILFLWLVCSVSVVVERNVYPVLPAIAILVGVGCGALAGRLAVLRRPVGAVVAAVVCAAAFLEPIVDGIGVVIAHANRSTRELAGQWMHERFPPGGAILVERYSPGLNRGAYVVVEHRFAPMTDFETMCANYDYLVLSSHTYGRWFEPNAAGVAHYDVFQGWYTRAFNELELLREFTSSRTRMGPTLRIYRVDPPAVAHEERRHFDPGDVFLPGSWKLQPEGHVWYDRQEQWSVVKGHFAAGRYELRLEGGAQQPARVEIVDARNEPIASLPLMELTTAPFELPRADRYYFRLHMAPGSYIQGVVIARIDGAKVAVPSTSSTSP